MKNDVSYELDNGIRKEIVCVKNLILDKFNNASIFLFGSIAKGKYKNNSDIDILLLLDELKKIRESL